MFVRAVLLWIISIFLFTCGDDYTKEDNSYKDDDVFLSDIKPILDRSCSECHSGAAFIQHSQPFKSSQARVRLANQSMPKSPSKSADQFSSADRNKLLAYLQN